MFQKVYTEDYVLGSLFIKYVQQNLVSKIMF